MCPLMDSSLINLLINVLINDEGSKILQLGQNSIQRADIEASRNAEINLLIEHNWQPFLQSRNQLHVRQAKFTCIPTAKNHVHYYVFSTIYSCRTVWSKTRKNIDFCKIRQPRRNLLDYTQHYLLKGNSVIFLPISRPFTIFPDNKRKLNNYKAI